jgi:hypothetical protein
MADAPATEKAQGVVTTAARSSEHHDDHHEEGFHTIAGFKVGEKNVPFSVIVTFLFIATIAAIAWIPTQGF